MEPVNQPMSVRLKACPGTASPGVPDVLLGTAEEPLAMLWLVVPLRFALNSL